MFVFAMVAAGVISSNGANMELSSPKALCAVSVTLLTYGGVFLALLAPRVSESGPTVKGTAALAWTGLLCSLSRLPAFRFGFVSSPAPGLAAFEKQPEWNVHLPGAAWQTGMQFTKQPPAYNRLLDGRPCSITQRG